MRKILLFCILILSVAYVWADDHKSNNITLNDDNLFNYQAIRTLSYAPFKGADIKEVFLTTENIIPGDNKSWHKGWDKTAKRLYSEASRMINVGHTIEARNLLLRASNYYRAAEFFLRENESLQQAEATFQKSKHTFSQALKFFPNSVELINIPFEGIYLPGYFIQAQSCNKRPLIILNTGFDGTAEELFFLAYEACIERDYNCLIFEGPGQGDTLRKHKLPFRHNWETVITPVLDWTLQNKKSIDSNRVALVGISMGGYLVPRALAYDNRVKLGIINGGIVDFHTVALQGGGERLKSALNQPEAKDKINEAIVERMKQNSLERWFFGHGMYSFKKDNPVDFLLETKKYTLTDQDIFNIKSKVLVIDSDQDAMLKSQSKQLYDKLSTAKSWIEFTKSEGAEMHCQAGALMISRAKIFNWIDENI